MLKAQLRGKLPSGIVGSEWWRTSEDLLTSNIFGTLANLPAEIACDVLGKAAFLEPGRLELRPPLTWEFWPWWVEPADPRNGAEPDVVIHSPDALVVIEAKLWAAFGSAPDKRDQLDREWHHATLRAVGKQVWLIVATPHAGRPIDEIRLQLRGNPSVEWSRVGWIGWSDIGRSLRRLAAEPRWATVVPWLNEMRSALASVGVADFDGFLGTASAARALSDERGRNGSQLHWRAGPIRRAVRTGQSSGGFSIGYDPLIRRMAEATPTLRWQVTTWF